MIVIVGGGAIGQLVAGQLARAGQQIGLIGRSDYANGYSLRIRQGDQTVEATGIVATSRPEALADTPPALAIVAVKAYDTEQALATLDRLEPQAILTLQNGIGNEEILARHFGPDHVLAGAITSSVVVEQPGQITVTKVGGIGLAQVGDCSPLARWGAVLREAGFVVRDYADYRALKWSKALLNMLGNATSAILDMPPAAIYAHRDLVALELAAQREALAVMRQRQIVPVNLPRYPAATLAWAEESLPLWLLQPILRRLVGGGRGGKMPSLHGDLVRGRQYSEGAQLYGMVAQEAAALGIAAPANELLWQTLQHLISGSASREDYRQQPARLLARR